VRRLDADNVYNRRNNELLGTGHNDAANSGVLGVELVQVCLTLKGHDGNGIVAEVGCGTAEDNWSVTAGLALEIVAGVGQGERSCHSLFDDGNVGVVVVVDKAGNCCAGLASLEGGDKVRGAGASLQRECCKGGVLRRNRHIC
jgi:hypothetical protein